MRPLIALCLTVSVAGGPAVAGIAGVYCDAQDRIKTQLQMRMGARLQGRGLRGPDAVMEVWIVPRTGDWTLVQSYANGRSCVVAMGEGWEALTLPDPA